MKFSILLLSGLIFASFRAHAQQGGGPRGEGRREAQPQAQSPLPAIPLTPQQVEVINKQLADLEKQIQDMRGSTLGAVMQKLRSAVASDAASLSLLLDSEKLVNVERKDLDKTEERQRKENARRDRAEECDQRERERGPKRQQLRTQHEQPPIVVVGQRARHQREEEERQRAHCLHERNLVRARRDERHLPRCTHGLDEAAERRRQRSPPENREHAIAERRKCRGAPALEAGGRSRGRRG